MGPFGDACQSYTLEKWAHFAWNLWIMRTHFSGIILTGFSSQMLLFNVFKKQSRLSVLTPENLQM
jgi:hypothetical protein